MIWLLSSMGVLLAGAVAALLLSRTAGNSPRSASILLAHGTTDPEPAGRMPALPAMIGAGSTVIAAGLGFIPVVQVLLGGSVEPFHFPWSVPFGEFFIELDPLSAWFLIPTLLLSALAAIYGVGYLR